MNKTLTLFACMSLLGASHLSAQDADSKAQENVTQSGFWEAKLPGGAYMVRLSTIASISMHSYSVKGAIVHEVAIETTGAALTRIYAMQALGENSASGLATNLIQRGKELGSHVGNKVGFDPNTAVHKEYPLTTHAKTIEYRVVDKADLDQIYKSLSKSWRSGRGRKITIK